MSKKLMLCTNWNTTLAFHQSPQEIASASYNNVLKHQHTLSSYNDLMYFLKYSPLKDISQYFVRKSQTEKENLWNTYQIENKWRKINAVNFFREGIEPTWEDTKNARGGRIIFQISKDIEDYQQILRWILLYFLGENYEYPQDINGIRFISPKLEQQCVTHFRVEIWVAFRKSETNKVESLLNIFMKTFAEKFQIRNFRPFFAENSK